VAPTTMPNHAYVAGIPSHWTEDDLNLFFSPLAGAQVYRHGDGASTGHGCVKFKTHAAQQQALLRHTLKIEEEGFKDDHIIRVTQTPVYWNQPQAEWTINKKGVKVPLPNAQTNAQVAAERAAVQERIAAWKRIAAEKRIASQEQATTATVATTTDSSKPAKVYVFGMPDYWIVQDMRHWLETHNVLTTSIAGYRRRSGGCFVVKPLTLADQKRAMSLNGFTLGEYRITVRAAYTETEVTTDTPPATVTNTPAATDTKLCKYCGCDHTEKFTVFVPENK